ncbi:MAG TPA: threonine--tRNA ligase [Candidatus Saccharimonadales bacterium]|nr:threonine--tRNA ligase [Candidatus Saccharimonadales bacterium]
MADHSDNLYSMRHSAAHIMAAAIQHLWPEAKFGVGPVVEGGFYYDVDLGDVGLSEADFGKIETEMRNIIKADQPFERFEKPIDEAIAWAKEAKQPYKEELLNDLKRSGTTLAKDLSPGELGTVAEGEGKVDRVSFYKDGDFVDLCRGPHVESTGKVGVFKLMRVAGAYWRGKEQNSQMQRIYGVAFETEDELKKYLAMLEEAKKRDHRKLGQELDLFTFSDLIGAGLPLWTPRGTILRRELDRFVQEMRDDYGYQEVSIPHITKKEAYIASGHWQKFEHELFRITTREGHEFAMKPMNCPHHTQIYARKVHSYKDLPVRYRETTTCYRDEQTGELSGLSRLRAFSQDDAHVFCRHSQIEQEVLKIWDIIDRFYGVFDFPLTVRFSRHDPANMAAYLGKPETWTAAEKQLKRIVEQKVGNDFIDGLGEAAFYGPKIDFMSQDALGRTWQVATIQLDFNQPEGFDLACINEKSERERIVMIHAAIMGSIDRFLAILLEHTAGRLPVWVAPEQVRLITLNQEESTVDFAEKVLDQAKDLGLRVTIDNDNESVGKKIRNAELMKVPYVIVIGSKEIESGQVVPRIRKDMEVQTDQQPIGIPEFLKTVANEAKGRVTKTSMQGLSKNQSTG